MPTAPHRAPIRLRSFTSRWWAEVRALHPHNNAHWPALRVGLCVALPLAVLTGIGHPEWAAYAVFGAVNSVYGKQHDYDARLVGQAITGAALVASVVMGTAVGVVAPGSWLAVVAMAVLSLAGYLLSQVTGWLPVPSLFLVFACGTLSSYRHRAGDVVIGFGLATAAALFSAAVGQMGRVLPTSRRPRRARPTQRSLHDAVGSRADLVAYPLGPLLAGGSAMLAGVGHPYWAAVTATVPLVGASLAARTARATLRLVGTIVGVGATYVLLVADPNPWLLIAALAIAQVATELYVARNYGVAVVGITAMALIMSHLAAPVPVSSLIRDRVIETALGGAVTVAVLLVVRPLRDPVPRVPGEAGAVNVVPTPCPASTTAVACPNATSPGPSDGAT